MNIKWRIVVLLLVPLSIPGLAFAQSPSSIPPHPTMPWFGLPYPVGADYGIVPNRPPKAQDVWLYGTVVRYIEVPPQQVVINTFLAGPGSFSGEYQEQVVEIPGYIVTETTTGYLYPARTVLEQPTPGVYQWRVLPKFFTRK